MIPYDLPPLFMAVWLFIYGAALGSFLTVCVHRLPPHESVWAAWRSLGDGPSHCDRCQKHLLMRDNIPIFGWLKLRGRCRFCKRSIPGKYPLIEFANGLLFVLVYMLEVPINRIAPFTQSCLACSIGPADLANGLGLSPVAFVNWRFLYHLVLVEALFVASLIDWDLMIIPDSVTLPPMLVGVTGAALFGKFWLVPVWFQDPSIARRLFMFLPKTWNTNWLTVRIPGWIELHPHWHGLAVSLAGFVVGGGIVWGVRIVGHFAMRREAMGFGDVVLMAMVGSFTGWQPVVVAFFIAPLLALASVVVARIFQPDREIPYGPYLSLGTLITLLGWRWIWPRVELYFSIGLGLLVMAVVMAALLIPMLYLFRIIKRVLGYPDYTDEDFLDEDWTSADQLSHFAGETVDPQQGQWRSETWPGNATGRGQAQLNQWLRPGGNGIRQHWNRRGIALIPKWWRPLLNNRGMKN